MNMDLNYDLIGKRIRQYREVKGLSQEELGAIISISNRHLSKVETGIKNPSLTLIIDIANALDVTANDLLVDYLTSSTISQKEEIVTFLNDCTPTEKAILMDMLKHMKKPLSEHGI